MAGHLFVIQGDLTRLSCDAWLLPTDRSFSISEDFATDEVRAALQDREWGGEYLLPLTEQRPLHGPWIWLGDIGRSGEKNAHWYAKRGVSFVERVATSLAPTPSTRGRHLVGVNVLGTGQGGIKAESGDVHRSLLPALAEVAARKDIDVALVTWGDRAYSAAQRVRRHMLEDGTLPDPEWSELPPSLRDAIPALAERAQREELVLFVGAGVSAAAGLPVWQELIDDLAGAAGIGNPELARLHDLDLRDQAAVIANRKGQSDEAFRSDIAERLRISHYSLSHGLLASLNVREAVTTNYDELLEMACNAGRSAPMAVLPYEGVEGHGRWLLKLHGSIRGGGDLTLTRDDYSSLAQKYAALFGLVQAMLLTRHMLFLGYSMTDEDFHSVVREVRVARSGMSQSERFGTVVSSFENSVFKDLWEDDLHVLSLGPHPGLKPTETDFAAVGRRLELFLDRLCLEAATLDRFLLDPIYGSILDDGSDSGNEHALRDALTELRHHAESAGDTPGWAKVKDLLKSFGG